MNKSQINKLIAEFMDIEYIKEDNFYIGADFLVDLAYRTNNGIEFNELYFNVSWDWLIPVIQKIESIEYVDEFTIKYCSIFGYSVTILPALKNTFNPICINSKVNTKIHVVISAIIEFINRYNSK